MPVSRRHFLYTASAFLAGAALPSEAAVRPRLFTKQVPLTDVDEAVVAWVKGYATKVRLKGISVLGKIRGGKRLRTQILAEIPSREALDAAVDGLSNLNLTVHVDDDTIAFTFQDTEYTIENLLAADFEAKLQALLTRLGVTFAADGITWNPDTLELSDPFGATLTDVVKLIRPGVGLEQLFDTLLKGLDQAKEAKLGLGTSFKSFRHRVLSLPGRRVAVSSQVLRQFIGELPDLSQNVGPGALIAFIASPLVSGVLGRELGLDIGQVLARFDLLRLVNAFNVSDAAILLTTLIQEAVDLGDLEAYTAHLNPFQRARFQQALAEARSVELR